MAVDPARSAAARSVALTAPALNEREKALLRALRRLASESMLTPRGDLDRACALLAADPAAEARRYGLALFRSFADLSDRPLRMRPLGAPEPSFDEIWLLALIKRMARREGSAEHLIAFRIPPRGRRRLRFLAAGLSRGADRLEEQAKRSN